MDTLIFAYKGLFEARAQQQGNELRMKISLVDGGVTSVQAGSDAPAGDWNALVERFLDPLEAPLRFLPSDEFEGAWYGLIHEDSDPPEYVFWDEHIYDRADVKRLLLEMDKSLSLTPTTARALIDQAAVSARTGDAKAGFRWAEAAWRWTRLPHVNLPAALDDTGLKFVAAQAQFDSGKTSQAIAMVARFAMARVERLEELWK